MWNHLVVAKAVGVGVTEVEATGWEEAVTDWEAAGMA